VSGQVVRVLVRDNQRVQAGDVLVELDDSTYAARVASAAADVAAATASANAADAQLALTRKQSDANIAIARGGVSQAAAVVGSTRAQIDQAHADVDAATARVQLAQTELARTTKLVDEGAVPRAELDSRRDQLDEAQAALAQAKARVASADANVSNSTGTTEVARGRLLVAQTADEQVAVAAAQVALARAKVDQTTAALRQAELDLGFTKVRAEIAGTVAKRTVEPGQMVAPDRALLAVVDTKDTWIVANFKETQLDNIHAGERVTISIDGVGGPSLVGVVDSLQPGTGSRFSLLPPDNASGNFTKVTQRVPVKIVVPHDAGAPELRPGTSADVTVYTAE
jgi:membrane fusion protein (multidrug efflux system)